MQNISYCADLVRRSDNDRFLCAQFAPPHVREALYALYAFNIELARIPERVSEPLLGEIRFQWWRDAMGAIFEENPSAHEVIGPLAKAIGDFALDRALLGKLIDTRMRDLAETPIADMVMFDDYAAGTAGVLAQLTQDIIGVDDALAREAASNVAVAWAVCAVLRAVPYHAGRGQVFVPLQTLAAAGAHKTMVLSRQGSPEIKQAMGLLADYARRRLAAARIASKEIPRAALPALLPAALADAWLTRFQKAGFNPFDATLQRVAATRPLRLWFYAWRGRY